MLPAVLPVAHSMYCMLQTDAEARMRADQGPLFKPKTPEHEYELGSRHRKAGNLAMSKIVQKREETAQIPHYDEAGQQVMLPLKAMKHSQGAARQWLQGICIRLLRQGSSNQPWYPEDIHRIRPLGQQSASSCRVPLTHRQQSS